MKSNQPRKASLTGSLLKDLLDRQKIDSKQNNSEPSIGSEPLPAPDLYQDPGGAYNPDFTFPQE